MFNQSASWLIQRFGVSLSINVSQSVISHSVNQSSARLSSSQVLVHQPIQCKSVKQSRMVSVSEPVKCQLVNQSFVSLTWSHVSVNQSIVSLLTCQLSISIVWGYALKVTSAVRVHLWGIKMLKLNLFQYYQYIHFWKALTFLNMDMSAKNVSGGFFALFLGVF